MNNYSWNSGIEDEEMIQRMAEIPLENKGKWNREAEVTPGMRAELAKVQGNYGKAQFMAKNQAATFQENVVKKPVDTRTQEEKEFDQAQELRNPYWRGEYETNRYGDRDEYEANLPILRNGYMYNKQTGKPWTAEDEARLQALKGTFSKGIKDSPLAKHSSEKLYQMAQRGEIAWKALDAILASRGHRVRNGQVARSLREQKNERILRGGV